MQPRAVGRMLGRLCVDFGFIAVCVFILTFLLRGACLVFNRLAGPNRGVPEPGFGKALGITIAAVIANWVAAGALQVALAAIAGLDDRSLVLLATVLAMPVGFLVLATATTLLLPTSFGRALLLALIAYGLAILAGVAVAAVLFAIAAARGI